MNVKYGGIFAVTERISNFFFLNLLWILTCLPIITIFPSTSAMYAVIREWVTKGETSLFRIFFRKFKENFKQSFILGLAWLLYGLIVFANINIMESMTGIFPTIILTLLLLVGFLFVLITVYMFPLMVHYDLPTPGLWKNSLLLSLTFFPASLIAMMILLVMIILTYLFPIFLTFVFSVSAYLLFLVCFQKIRQPN